MDPNIHHNGRILLLKEAHLSPGQVGLLMGWGVFTTLRLYRGVPFAFERHWARMSRDAARMEMDLGYGVEAVRKAVEELARANQRSDGAARVSFVKNHGGLWAEPAGHPPTDLLIFTRDLVHWPVANRLVIEPMGILSGGHYAGAKMLSWVPHAAVLERAHAAGFDDALLINERGQIAECTSANFFLVRGGRVFTPPLSSGCLGGITREVLLDAAPKAGIEIIEQELTVDDLATAEEVFISSTTREIAPVDSISPQWKFRAPGQISVALEQVFQGVVESYVESARHAGR
ncbi:MAG: aminotransferase class IV [Terriglobia bacterium]